MPHYDIIGDVHGHARRLESLLAKMGYRREGPEVWRHAGRTAVFVGDFVDRGPENLRAALIAKGMWEAGAALAIPGNHDLNVYGLLRSDPMSGGWLRPRTEKNLAQSGATLAEVEAHPQAGKACLDWFARLPLWIERDGFRAVHACWDPALIATARPHLNADASMPEGFVLDAFRAGTLARRVRDVLLTGPEQALPEGAEFTDADGHRRGAVRLRWWTGARCPASWAAAGIGVPASAPPPIPPPDLSAYASDGTPTFFGHYWLTGTPTPLRPATACLDYSVARDGALVAYRWDGERVLDSAKFVAA